MISMNAPRMFDLLLNRIFIGLVWLAICVMVGLVMLSVVRANLSARGDADFRADL